jgi:hypothetical protein
VGVDHEDLDDVGIDEIVSDFWSDKSYPIGGKQKHNH